MRPNYGVIFDGDDVVVVAHAASLNVSSLSIECWVYPTTLVGDNRRITSKGANDYMVRMVGSDGGIGFIVYVGAAAKTAASSITASINNWYHIVGVYDSAGSNVLIYVNNTADTGDAATGDMDNNANNFEIGRRQGTSDDYFIGTMDEVRVYNRALSATEVAYNYNSGTGTYEPYSRRGLVAWYHMDENSGSYIYDYSGHGNTGTITGAAFAAGKEFMPMAPVARKGSLL